jgi:hypothetical protein
MRYHLRYLLLAPFTWNTYNTVTSHSVYTCKFYAAFLAALFIHGYMECEQGRRIYLAMHMHEKLKVVHLAISVNISS